MSLLRWHDRLRSRRLAKLAAQTDGPSPENTISLFGPNGVQYARLVGEKRTAPAVVSLSNNTNETLAFLSETRTNLQNGWTGQPRNRSRRRALQTAPMVVRSYCDYSTIKEIGADAALVLASEYDRMRRKGGWLPRAIDIDKWNPNVRRELEGVGFLELVGITRSGDAYVDRDQRRILKFQANSQADGKQVFQLLRDLGMPDTLDMVDLYSAIVEAIVNTRQHAYPADMTFPEPHVPNWWLSASLDRVERRLRVSVYDHGATIPRTLARWERYPMFARAFVRVFRESPDPEADRFDGQALAVAMAVGRTATGKEYRGKGLAFMESILNRCERGRLSIYSRRGSYLRRKGERPV